MPQHPFRWILSNQTFQVPNRKSMALTDLPTCSQLRSPWYDGPCADDTGSWLQPSRYMQDLTWQVCINMGSARVIVANWCQTLEIAAIAQLLGSAGVRIAYNQQMKPSQPNIACLLFPKHTKNSSIPIAHHSPSEWMTPTPNIARGCRTELRWRSLPGSQHVPIKVFNKCRFAISFGTRSHSCISLHLVHLAASGENAPGQVAKYVPKRSTKW